MGDNAGMTEQTCATPSSMRPRIALYSHDTMGLGHIRRNTLIAQTFIQPPLSAQVLLVSGIRESGAFALPPGIDSITLPAYRKRPDGNYTARALDMPLEQLVALRSQTILAALTAFAPQLLIVDNVPRGALSELDTVLPTMRARGTHIVLGLRDIIDTPEAVARQWERQKNADILRRCFDAVWIYGDPRVYDTISAYGLDRLESIEVTPVGYLDPNQRWEAKSDTGGTASDGTVAETSDAPYALCMMGGGQDGLAVAFAGIHYSFTAHAKDIYHQYEEPVQLDLKIRDAAFTVTVSDYNVDYLRTHFGAPTDRTHRIYNGLDLSAFPYHPPINRPSNVVAVGRLVEKKGFPFLIEAIGLLRDRGIDCRCTLVGDGPLRPQLQKQVEDLGLTDRVQLAGVRPLTEVSAFLKGAAVLVAPSIISEGGDRDGLPTILVEGMALGTPCISTQVVGIPELIRDHETGLCVPPNDAKVLADAIAEMLGNPTMARLLADNARALIESEYDVHRNTARLRDLFAQSIQAVDAQDAAHRPNAVE